MTVLKIVCMYCGKEVGEKDGEGQVRRMVSVASVGWNAFQVNLTPEKEGDLERMAD